MIRRFVIFGASGDLTSRYLMPALAMLVEADKVPRDLTILGIGREPWDNEGFQRHIAQTLTRRAPHLSAAARQAFIARLTYRRADATDREQVARALHPLTEPIIAYLALPPPVFSPTIEALAALGPPRDSRIVVEKPFGENLASARALNRRLHQSFPEQAVFRLDHFLGKQTVQNILGLRFGNRVFEPIWSSQHIERVEIIWDETLALEGRAAYYDQTGALRDMIQNHLLQLLCLVGMEAPLSMTERDLRDRKVDVLRAVRTLSGEEVERVTVRGRYTAGRLGDRPIPAYVDEPGVNPARQTETFAQVTLQIDNWRWDHVPFVLRTGKALARDRQEIAIYFQPVPHQAFVAGTGTRSNVLRFQLNPDRMLFTVNINGVGDPFDLEPIDLHAELAPQTLPAYGRILLDVLEGQPALAIRDDEAEESWRIVEPILDAWNKGRVPLLDYPAGSDGPRVLAQ